MYSEKPKLHEKNRQYVSGNLRSLIIDVTSRCNMRCPHCYFHTFMDHNLMPLDKLKVTMDEAHAMGVFHYILTGGEPTMDLDRLATIIEFTRPDESYINITSNGWKFDRNMARHLRELKADKVVFSLDSGIEAEHDKGRGKGSFRYVMAAIDHVLAEGLLSGVSFTASHATLHSEGFKAAYEYTVKKKIRFELQVAMPVGMWDGQKDILITPEDARYIEELRDKTPLLPNGQKAVSRDVFNYNGPSHCPAAIEFMAITADGNIMPCNFCQNSIGKVGEGSLAAMRSALMTSPLFRGEVAHCLVGQDEDYIDTYIIPYVNQSKPLDAYEVFNLPRQG